MDKTNVRKITYDYSLEVAKVLKPEKIILFGSHVVGNPHDESDIDIAVFVRGLDDNDWYEARIALQNILWNRTFLSIEPHLIDEAHDRSGFAEHVIKTGEIIYSS